MGFAERAVTACDHAMSAGTLSDRHVRDVLKCDKADIRPLVRHLLSGNSVVRMGAARIVGKMGDVKCLLDAVMREKDPMVLREILHILGKHSEGARALEQMVSSDDDLVREEVISMLRRSGNAESLFPLLFDKDDALVNRIKRYIRQLPPDNRNEQIKQETGLLARKEP